MGYEGPDGGFVSVFSSEARERMEDWGARGSICIYAYKRRFFFFFVYDSCMVCKFFFSGVGFPLFLPSTHCMGMDAVDLYIFFHFEHAEGR